MIELQYFYTHLNNNNSNKRIVIIKKKCEMAQAQFGRNKNMNNYVIYDPLNKIRYNSNHDRKS